MSTSVLVDKLSRWVGLLDMVPVRLPSVAYRQLKREMEEELANAILLRTREETQR